MFAFWIAAFVLLFCGVSFFLYARQLWLLAGTQPVFKVAVCWAAGLATLLTVLIATYPS